MRKLRLFGIILIGVGKLWAADAPAATAVPTPSTTVSAPLKQHLEALRLKLEHVGRRANQPVSGATSVIAVRGDDKSTQPARQLYWKGKKKNEPLTPDEVLLFRKAVDQAEAGQSKDAIATLADFETKYPKSPLLSDVHKTRRLLEQPS